MSKHRTPNEELFALVLKHWQALPSERDKASFLVSVLAVAASLLFGTILALYYHWSKTALRQVLQLTVFLPFVLPQVITGLALLIATTMTPVSTGLVAVTIGQTIFVAAIAYH